MTSGSCGLARGREVRSGRKKIVRIGRTGAAYWPWRVAFGADEDRYDRDSFCSRFCTRRVAFHREAIGAVDALNLRGFRAPSWFGTFPGIRSRFLVPASHPGRVCSCNAPLLRTNSRLFRRRFCSENFVADAVSRI